MTDEQAKEPLKPGTTSAYVGDEKLGCFGWFCAAVGITPARVAGKKTLAREAERDGPRVISLKRDEERSEDREAGG